MEIIKDNIRSSFFIFICLLFFTPQAWASLGNYPDPNRQTMWNSLTDTIHTIGQDPVDARMIKWRLRNQRRINRIRSINEARIRAWKNSP